MGRDDNDGRLASLDIAYRTIIYVNISSAEYAISVIQGPSRDGITAIKIIHCQTHCVSSAVSVYVVQRLLGYMLQT